MAIKANFTAGVLSVTGDNADDAIAITRDAAGQILINGGAISAQSAQEGQPTLTNATGIVVVADLVTTLAGVPVAAMTAT